MLTFKKAETWQCGKCNQTLALTFNIDSSQEEVFTLLFQQHAKATPDCSAPSGFRLVNTFLKYEELK